MQFFTCDQITGEKQQVYYEMKPGIINAAVIAFSGGVEKGWYPDIFFNSFSGFVEFLLQYNIPSDDKQVYYSLGLQVNLHTVSDLLLNATRGPKQRLYIMIRNTEGTLIGSSHGKYFSHSDVDFLKTIDPLKDRLPLDLFKKFTPINCTDVTISESGEYLWNTYKNWEAIPEFNGVQITVNNELYWFTSSVVTSEVLLT